MDKDKKIKFYELFEKLLGALTHLNGYDIEEIQEALSPLCEFFNISKGVTEFYKNISYEKTGRGDIFVAYDNGKGGKEIICRRIITKTMAIVKCSVFMPDDCQPLTSEEKKRVELVMRTLLSFISRYRLQTVVEEFAFYDNNGYRNIRAFLRYIESLKAEGKLYGNTAIHYNLRHFTLINREIGRSAGDIVIRNYFDLIAGIVGDKGIVCRVGGDNFVAVLEDSLLDNVLEALRGVPVIYDKETGKRVMISASTGVFRINKGFTFDDPGDIMGRILAASQAAKIGGKDSIVFYDDEMEMGKENECICSRVFRWLSKMKNSRSIISLRSILRRV